MTMRRWLFSFVLLAVAAPAAPASAQFSGDLAFTPDACKAKRSCILRNELTFVDPAKRIWRAAAGDVTDGASIPDWAQGVIGDRWDDSYIKAAVLHDHYCGTMRHSWKETHRMFYEALVALGVGELKAKLMYYAVYLAGPKWELAATPPACDPASGDTCLMEARPDGPAMVVRPDRYREMDMGHEIGAARDYMARNPGASLEQLEALAGRARPDDRILNRDTAGERPSQ